MSASTTGKASGPAISQKCTYCNGTGRWSKDVIAGKPPESVYCPHCHGTGAGGTEITVSAAASQE